MRNNPVGLTKGLEGGGGFSTDRRLSPISENPLPHSLCHNVATTALKGGVREEQQSLRQSAYDVDREFKRDPATVLAARELARQHLYKFPGLVPTIVR